MTIESLQSYENCTTLTGGLYISGFSDSSQLIYFLKLKYIKGDVEIQNTALKDLSFLKSLKEIRSKHGKINRNAVLNVHDNYEMTRLGLDNLVVKEKS